MYLISDKLNYSYCLITECCREIVKKQISYWTLFGLDCQVSRYWKKDDRNNGKKWEIISGLLCNQKYKEAHTVVSLMIKETILLLANTWQKVLL